MWILLQLALAYTADVNQLLYEAKIQNVKIRSEMDRFEQKHTKSCDKIVNRLRYMADAEALGNKMEEQNKRFRRINTILHQQRSVTADQKLGSIRDQHKVIVKRYKDISDTYQQCLAAWPNPASRRNLAGR